MTNQSETGTHLPWQPSDLPTLRAAYSDRTAALMAFLAGFAYRNSLSRASGAVEVPPELGVLGFDKLTIFLNEFVDGLAFIAESKDLVALSFRGTRSPTNWNTNFTADLTQPDRKDGVDPKVKVHKGFHDAFDRLSAGTEGLSVCPGTY